MTPENIVRYLLARKKFTQKELADELGLNNASSLASSILRNDGLTSNISLFIDIVEILGGEIKVFVPVEDDAMRREECVAIKDELCNDMCEDFNNERGFTLDRMPQDDIVEVYRALRQRQDMLKHKKEEYDRKKKLKGYVKE